MQRRHQKVVEVAPAVGLDRDGLRELCDAAVRLARGDRLRQCRHGGVPRDVDASEWFFIEMNPRIQVEHTVTEMITGIDLVRSQILIAQGHALHGPEIDLPPQDEMPRNGYALQCRITTEDPANNFAPDYGKILTYRSPGGLRHPARRRHRRCRRGRSRPYYDSLLVKMTAWGRRFRHRLQRMDRALREFRIRGVKTNIPFLENVDQSPDVPDGPGDDDADRRHAGAVPVQAAPRPRHEAAQLTSATSSSTATRRQGLSSPAEALGRRRRPGVRPQGRRRRTARAIAAANSARRSSPQWTREAEAACSSPTPPSATRTSR